jgi:hypothetical protein
LEPKFEDQFTAYIDLLGFSKAVEQEDDSNINNIRILLTKISGMRSQFIAITEGAEANQTVRIEPMISTFSDNIVISYPLKPSYKAMGDTKSTLIVIMRQISRYIAQVAEDSLRIGLLVRGGATIGKLYHSDQMIFGKALVDAYYIETKVSNYPRVVLSPEITNQLTLSDMQGLGILRDEYGVCHFDYFKKLAMVGAAGANDNEANREIWAEGIVNAKRSELADKIKVQASKDLTKLEEEIQLMKKVQAKWEWFGQELRRGLERSRTQRSRASLI